MLTYVLSAKNSAETGKKRRRVVNTKVLPTTVWGMLNAGKYGHTGYLPLSHVLPQTFVIRTRQSACTAVLVRT